MRAVWTCYVVNDKDPRIFSMCWVCNKAKGCSYVRALHATATHHRPVSRAPASVTPARATRRTISPRASSISPCSRPRTCGPGSSPWPSQALASSSRWVSRVSLSVGYHYHWDVCRGASVCCGRVCNNVVGPAGTGADRECGTVTVASVHSSSSRGASDTSYVGVI